MTVSAAVFRCRCHASFARQQQCYINRAMKRHLSISSFVANATIKNDLEYSQTFLPSKYHTAISTRASSSLTSPVHDQSNTVVPALSSKDDLPVVPIDFQASSQISGEESQILMVNLKPNQILRAESGAMLFMTEGIEMSTSLGGKDGESSSTSLLKDGFKRMLTGQNLFVSDYSYHGEDGTEGTVALGTAFPSIRS
jgi:Uncharacterized conserved protein